MKIWWVLAWDKYYPSGGLGNVHSTWATRELAEAKAEELRNTEVDYETWYGADNIKVFNVSEML